MPRSDRGLIAPAIFGLIATSFGLGCIIAASQYPEPQRYQEYGNAREDKGGTTATANVSRTMQKHTPCQNPESRDESDLCAQWRAAKAGEESALWARIGFFAGLLGLIGLYWQVVLTRKAVEDTSEATEAMRESNRIAQDNARRQLRAYVSVSPGEFSLDMIKPREHKVTLALVFRNGGATPAYQFQHGGNIVVFQPDRARAYFTEGYKTAPITGEGSQITLHTQQDHYGVIESMRLITSAEFDQLQKGNASLYAYGFASYQDIFGVSYTTRFCYELEPADSRKSVGARDKSGEAPIVWTFPAFHNGAD